MRKEYDLPWLRVHFSYKRFSNLRELFMGDLMVKLLKGLKSRDFRTRTCNCDRRTRDDNGKYVYNGECRTLVIVYQVKCKDCGANYIGNTQQFFKNRMKQNYEDVGKFFRKGTQTDTFAKHFVGHFESVPAANDVHQKCEMKILQRINPFGFVKRVRSHKCQLCLTERYWLIKSRMKGDKLRNANSEIYGACRHQSSFHRFQLITDERRRREKGNDTDSEGECENIRKESLSIRIPNEVLCQPINSSPTGVTVIDI